MDAAYLRGIWLRGSVDSLIRSVKYSSTYVSHRLLQDDGHSHWLPVTIDIALWRKYADARGSQISF